MYPFGSLGLAPQDLKYKGEPTRLVDRQRQHLPRVRDDSPRHGRRPRRDDDRQPQLPDGVLPRGARLPRRQRHHPVARHHARRARRRGRLRHRSAATRACTSSAASGSTRSSAASRRARRTSCRTRRPWATAPLIYGLNTIGLVRRGFHARHRAQAEGGVPLPARVEAEHHPGPGAHRARTRRSTARRCATSCRSSATPSAAWC